MESDNELKIIITADDQASPKIEQVKNNIKGAEGATKSLSQESQAAGKNITAQYKEANSSLRDFRKSLLLVTVAIGTVIATTREAAKYSKEAAVNYSEFQKASESLSVTIGQVLAPAMRAITEAIKVMNDVVESAVAGFVKLTSFVAAFFANLLSGPVTAFKEAMAISASATDGFLKDMERTRSRVQQGLTFEKEKKEAIDLGRIVVVQGKLMRDAWDASVDALGQLEYALADASEMGKGWATAAAALALAMAVINTAQGITLAFATHPWPFSAVVAGIVAAAGAIQIATIAATKFHEGGVIRAHDGLAVDEVPIIAQTGEGVLSRRGMSALGGAGMLNNLNRGMSAIGSSIVINLTAVINNKLDIVSVAEELGFEIERQRRFARAY